MLPGTIASLLGDPVVLLVILMLFQWRKESHLAIGVEPILQKFESICLIRLEFKGSTDISWSVKEDWLIHEGNFDLWCPRQAPLGCHRKHAGPCTLIDAIDAYIETSVIGSRLCKWHWEVCLRSFNAISLPVLDRSYYTALYCNAFGSFPAHTMQSDLHQKCWSTVLPSSKASTFSKTSCSEGH